MWHGLLYQLNPMGNVLVRQYVHKVKCPTAVLPIFIFIDGSGFYDCRLNYSSLAVYGQSNPSSLAASIVGIVILLVTVAYVWLVNWRFLRIIPRLQALVSDYLVIANYRNYEEGKKNYWDRGHLTRRKMRHVFIRSLVCLEFTLLIRDLFYAVIAFRMNLKKKKQKRTTLMKRMGNGSFIILMMKKIE